MSAQQVAAYLMNPAEDVVIYGDDLVEGMWVLPENELVRATGRTEDAQIRGQRFRRVTQLRTQRGASGLPDLSVFIGEWVDGYQERHAYAVTWCWIVKRDDPAGTEATP